ncbi:phosphotransferase family protein [Dactylosporangium vinaceum]|uniref:Choline/ethanolamine kinase family protein n=1 Tax=Dactylosporangium vinaceum TaxID=53362 RepID=A0ABV5M001_9ACTN|nr:choline/ethanolamine kinase family protein [Dactylosporangium vinaceum]UAB98120.1 phosphotransferase family protein [Dactylosporangium vinaceum]
MSAVPSIADLLERVPSWVGRAVEWQRLQGGLSHHVYRVDVDQVPYVLRVLEPQVSAVGLGIAPAREIANTETAAESVGPQVYATLPDVPAIVLEFLPGRTLAAADVRRPVVIPALAEACRRLHAGPAFGNDFDIFGKRAELLEVCRRNDLPLPDGYRDGDSTVDAVREALDERPLRAVPCHNDLLAENFIATSSGVRIIDYQLSGNNDPAFELGDIAAEADYDPDLTGLLAEAYFGEELSPALLARVRLFHIASNVTWALWFTVHHGLLAAARGEDLAGFDYAAEAADKWGQARDALADPALGRLLGTVTGRNTITP